MKILFGLVQTTRFLKSLAVGALLALATGSMHYGICATLFLMFSFAFNDWVDFPKDKFGHPNRAIPSGKLTLNQASYIWTALLVIGVGWVIGFLSEYVLGFAIIYAFSIIYSYVLKPNIPTLATPIWSSTLAILFLQSLSANLTIYVAVTIIVYAYELLLDYRDRESDKEFCKTPTLANILSKHSRAVSGAFFLVGIALLIQGLT